jgi:rod shape determining protein RodA
MLISMLGLILLGIAFVYSASYMRESYVLRGQYIRHAVTAGIGLVIYLTLAYFDFQLFLRWSWVCYGVGVSLLILVLLIGEARMGAQRWVLGIQPSEIAKITTIMVLANYLGQRDNPRDIKSLLIACGLMLLPMGLIFFQPDLGSALIFVPTVMAMLFTARVAPRVFFTMLLTGILLVGVVLAALIASDNKDLPEATREKLCRVTMLSEYQRKRVMAFLYPERDPYGDGWNRRQSEIAIGSGKMWGKGYLEGDQNILGFLPAKVSANDFIFSVLAEETGFVGSMVLLLLFAGVILPVFVVAVKCRDGAGRLLCVGIGTLVFTHMFINVGMTVGMLPVSGVPLPFISYGRTFLLSIMAGLGLVQSVAVHAHRTASRF